MRAHVAPGTALGTALGALEILENEPDLGTRLLEKAAHFRKALQSHGLNTLQSASQIIPIVIGDNHQAMHIAASLKEQDILVGAIRPPTVPEGTARLRISLTLAHTDDDIDRATRAIIRATPSCKRLIPSFPAGPTAQTPSNPSETD